MQDNKKDFFELSDLFLFKWTDVHRDFSPS